MAKIKAMLLEEIYKLAFTKLVEAGSDEHNASILSTV